jgi:hypothetical protein
MFGGVAGTAQRQHSAIGGVGCWRGEGRAPGDGQGGCGADSAPLEQGPATRCAIGMRVGRLTRLLNSIKSINSIVERFRLLRKRFLRDGGHDWLGLRGSQGRAEHHNLGRHLLA